MYWVPPLYCFKASTYHLLPWSKSCGHCGSPPEAESHHRSHLKDTLSMWSGMTETLFPFLVWRLDSFLEYPVNNTPWEPDESAKVDVLYFGVLHRHFANE